MYYICNKQINNSDMTTTNFDIQTIINDARSLDTDNKKNIASKYGIESNKTGEIKTALYKMANDIRRGHSEFTEEDYRIFNLYWDVPESSQKIRKSMIDESTEFVKFYREMKIKTCRNKFHRSYTTTISVLDAIISERNESKDTILHSLVDLLNKQTIEFHDSYINMIMEYQSKRFDYLEKTYKNINSMWDIYQTHEGIDSEDAKKIYQAMTRSRRETSDFNKDKFMKDMKKNAEDQFNDSINMIAQRIKNAGMNFQDVKVKNINSNDAKAFDIHVTDGNRSMHARSIFCAEYSVLVSPHFRFIITNE